MTNKQKLNCNKERLILIREYVEKDLERSCKSEPPIEFLFQHLISVCGALWAYLIHLPEGHTVERITKECVKKIFEKSVQEYWPQNIIEMGLFQNLLGNTKKCGPIIKERYHLRAESEIKKVWEYPRQIEDRSIKLREQLRK